MWFWQEAKPINLPFLTTLFLPWGLKFIWISSGRCAARHCRVWSPRHHLYFSLFSDVVSPESTPPRLGNSIMSSTTPTMRSPNKLLTWFRPPAGGVCVKAPSSTGKWFCLYFQLRRPLRRKTRSNFACLAVTFCPFRRICENHLFTFSILRRGVRPSTTNLTQRSWVRGSLDWSSRCTCIFPTW